MTGSSNGNDRLHELLVDRATGELDDLGRAELERLLTEWPSTDPDLYERAAAAVQLATLEAPLPSLPDSLREKLNHDARKFLEAGRRGVGPTTNERPSGPRARSLWVGFISGVAASLLFVLGPFRGGDGSSAGPAEMRLAMLDSSDVVQVPWSPTADQLGQGVSGDVVWSTRERRGFMRFEDLAGNDPKQNQYQLWIFDAQRPDTTPVDGGVFDIPADGGEVVVPIDAKLDVGQATLFAITLERPGGVVVSERERLLLTAAVE